MRQTPSSPPAQPAEQGSRWTRSGRVPGITFARTLLVGMALLVGIALLGLGARPVHAEEKDAAKPKESPVPAVKGFLRDAQANPKAYKSLVAAARKYFDLDEQLWRGRIAFLTALGEEADKGRFWLKDLDALRWLIYQSRSFFPPMTDRKWRASQGIEEYKALGGTVHWIKSEQLTIAFSVPRKYPKPKEFKKLYPRIDPYPLLLTMHEKRDYTGQRYPGDVLLKRRYPKKEWKAFYETWITLCPIAAAGNYLNREKMIRAKAFQGPYSKFWKHYHIDFDRVILDGTQQAFSALASQAIHFAGGILRCESGKKWGLSTDEMKKNVKNFASVPVYVVNSPKLAAQLKEAGHPNVTAGVGGAHLFKWMGERRRVEPTKFGWEVQHIDQVLPYWVNLESVNWDKDVKKRSLQVEVVDTDKEPNTINIEAAGIKRIALFLNDEIVDLDRKVRVVINGNIEYDAKMKIEAELIRKAGRDFDLLFDRDPARIRLSMFFGWLKSARIVGLEVRKRAKKTPTPTVAAKDAGPQATEVQEAAASRSMTRAKRFIEIGKTEKAVKALQKILSLPKNAQTEEATAMLSKLETLAKAK